MNCAVIYSVATLINPPQSQSVFRPSEFCLNKLLKPLKDDCSQAVLRLQLAAALNGALNNEQWKLSLITDSRNN